MPRQQPGRGSDGVDLLMKVRYMYEYMALCADPTLFAKARISEAQGVYPVPSGVPTGITVLPDFVVDVHASKFNARTPPAGQPGDFRPIDVGSRAGRLVWILQELGGADDGLYQVNYVAKAGSLGRQVLEARLRREAERHGGDPLSLRHIFSAGDADWVAIYHDTRGRGSPRPLAESQPGELELTRGDVARSPFRPQDVFYGTRCVVVSSKHADRAVEALELVGQGLTQLAPLSAELRDFLAKRTNAVVTKPPVALLLDVSALGAGEPPEPVVDRFEALCESLGETCKVDSTVLCDGTEDEARALARRFANVLWRRRRSVGLWHGGTRCAKEVVPAGVDLRNLVTREALTAGYVLAATCDIAWRLLRLWALYDPHMRPFDDTRRPGPPTRRDDGDRSEAPDGGDVLPPLNGADPPLLPEQRLRYGLLLAEAMPREPSGYYQVVRRHSSGFRLRGAAELEGQVAKTLTQVPVDAAWVERLLGSRPWGDLGRADHARPRFVSRREERGLFLPPRDAGPLVGSCHIRDLRGALPRRQGSVEKVVMFDLDATLIDSPRLRRACWSAGLKGFFRLTRPEPSVVDADIEMIVTIYETFIYASNALFAQLLAKSSDLEPEWQPWDFRQVWDHPYAWAALLWLVDDRPRSQEVMWNRTKWQGILAGPSAHLQFRRDEQPDRLVVEGACSCGACQRLRSLAEAPDPARAFQPLRDRRLHFATAIDAARYAFWAIDVGNEGGIDGPARRVDYGAHPQARACIRAVRSQPDCEVYVVTEGHQETQFRKLRCAGLHDLFPRERVLTTGAAGNPANARGDLEALQRRCEAEVQLLEAMEPCGRADRTGCAIEQLLQERRRHLEAVKLLLSLIDVLRQKGAQSFYSAVVDAIRVNSESPAEVLRSFAERRQSAYRGRARRSLRTPRKFVMVGDRYDYDCRPLLELLQPAVPGDRPKVGVFRVLSGRRAREFPPPEEEKEPDATYVCDSLLQVAHVLGGATVWGAIDAVEDLLPPVLLSEPSQRICCGPGSAANPLAPQFPLLALAVGDPELGAPRAVRDIIALLVQDISLCSVAALQGFWQEIAPQVRRMWEESDAAAYQGALQLLSGVNEGRYELGRPAGGAASSPESSLEWVLGAQLLRRLGLPPLPVGDRVLQPATNLTLQLVDPATIVRAIPFSQTGQDVVEALQAADDPAVAASVRSWLGKQPRPGRRRRGRP